MILELQSTPARTGGILFSLAVALLLAIAAGREFRRARGA